MSDQLLSALVIAALVAMGVAVYAGRALADRPHIGRRVYWGGWALAIPLFAIGMAAPLWPNVVAAVAILGIAAIAMAYIVTPYLTVGGQTYSMQDRYRSED